MSTIRVIYEKDPGFPATDQHPDAVRYQVGTKFVDAIGGQPTQAEVDAVLGLDAASIAEATRVASVNTAISGDAQIQALKVMTVSDFDAWWTANVTTVAQAITIVKRIARIVVRKLL